MSDSPDSGGELPAILRDALASRRVFNAAGERVELSSNVSLAEAAQLHAAVRELRPRMSVEVGFAQGVSTIAILDALRTNAAGHHHVIDPFQAHFAYCGCAMVARARLETWHTFHEKFADEIIPQLPRIQFAFIDSSHLFDLTIAEFVLVDRKLDCGGVIGFHDMWMPSQQAVIRYLLSNRAYEVWRPEAWPMEAEGAPEAWWKRALRSVAVRMPGVRARFSTDFLQPWQNFRIGNLVFLRKTAEDSRDWRFHMRF